MPYDERFITPMRQELTRLGVEELRTADEVEQALAGNTEPTLLVVNSMCGCAARNARPAVEMALHYSDRKPAKLTTVVAGQDLDATARARDFIIGYPPSSPSIALLKDGDVAFMLERHQIEGRSADAIAQDLVQAFQEYC
jgi:putative YphP/YqiW family bacilliredoxin